jgi:hypothetical protein
VNLGGHSKIRFNGQEYSSPDELPPDAQTACRQTALFRIPSLSKYLDKIIVNGREISGRGEEGRRLYQDIMSVVENNGHVTLPISSEPLLTSRRIKMGLALVAAMAAVALAVAAKTFG